jgi:hypothetical protein
VSPDFTSLATLLLLAGVVAGCARGQDAEAKQRQLETMLRANLPTGSSIQKVDAFLADIKLEHSRYDSDERNIVALDRNVESGGMVTTDIRIECRFDATDKLRNCDTKLVYTGP